MPSEHVAAVAFMALTTALAAARPGVTLKDRQTSLTVRVGQQELTECHRHSPVQKRVTSCRLAVDLVEVI